MLARPIAEPRINKLLIAELVSRLTRRFRGVRGVLHVPAPVYIYKARVRPRRMEIERRTSTPDRIWCRSVRTRQRSKSARILRERLLGNPPPTQCPVDRRYDSRSIAFVGFRRRRGKTLGPL